jgi:nucleoprotein TPR
MAAAAVDVGYLAASYSVPENSLHALLTEPTVALVQSLLVQIEARAREFDDLRSDKIKADVELEAAVQSGDSRARTLKAAADQAQKDAQDLREKLAAEGAHSSSLPPTSHGTLTSSQKVHAARSRPNCTRSTRLPPAPPMRCRP